MRDFITENLLGLADHRRVRELLARVYTTDEIPYENRRPLTLLFGDSAAVSASGYLSMVDNVVCTSAIGYVMPADGRIVHASILTNITNAVDSNETLTFNVRIGDTQKTALDLAFDDSDGTGVATDQVTDAADVTFSQGNIIQAHQALSGGTAAWTSVQMIVCVELDL